MADLTIIRNLCRERSITIRELAQRIGRDESSLQSAIRRGTTNTHTLELIARELGVSAGIFFEGYPRDGTKELRTEIAHLKEIIKEKERLIAVLMESKKH